MTGTIERLAEWYPAALTSYDELSGAYLASVFEERTNPARDLATPLRLGKDWLFASMAVHQPLTHAALTEASELRLVQKSSDGHTSSALVLLFGDRVVEVGRKTWNHNPADPGYPAMRERTNEVLTARWGRPTTMIERHMSLPETIRASYYERFDGLNLPRRVPWGLERRLLPRPTDRWQAIDNYLESIGRMEYLQFVQERIPSIIPEPQDEVNTKFMLFLDSRPDLAGTTGDAFFVETERRDGPIYYVRDSDFMNMMILSDPVAALDRYCAHHLRGQEGRFDFMPFATEW